jgi:hypothetical protein
VEEIHADMLDRIRIIQTDFRDIGLALGNLNRINDIAPFASGSMIYETVQGEGSVSARLFLEWWLSEDNFINLKTFLEKEFSGRAQLLERSGSHSCRYRIRKIDHLDEVPSVGGSMKSNSSISSSSSHSAVPASSNALSEIFAKIEAKKTVLNVQEYSVGQTTLEQIFNQFASQQDNPEIAMMLQAGDGRMSSLDNNRTRTSIVRVD